MRRIAMSGMIMVVALLLAVSARAQQAPAEMVLYNGKIVTVDDHGFTSRLGTMAQAMHIKDGKILHLGTNSEIRAMAGPNTKQMDLKGRTVIPGIILTHEHPWDWNPTEPYPVKAVLNDDTVIARFLEGSPDENVKAFPGVLSEAVKKAKPGQWIYIVLTYGKHYEYAPWGTGRLGRKGLDPKSYDPVGEASGILNKAGLDAAAPNNPVVVRDVFVSMQMNQKALEESRKVFPELAANQTPAGGGSGGGEGGGAGPSFRWMFQNVVMKDYYPQLAELMRLGLEWWAGYGMTTFASNAYDPMNVRVYWELDRKGKMPVREMWSWNWRNQRFASDPFYLNTIANLTGYGTDYFWFGGATIVQGRGCTVAPLLNSSRLAQSTETGLAGFYSNRVKNCAYSPGSVYAKLLYDYIKAGGRFVNHHMIGDLDIDYAMTIIEKASKDAGMTEEEIRAKRHTFDHSVMFPRPDQVEILRRLGIITSGTPFEIYLGSPAARDLWGEGAVNWEVPKKRLVEGQIYNSLELDHAIGSTDLTILSAISWMITRKSWDGKVYAPDQRIDRATALKIATIWGAYYVVRENVLGSLEPGKWADFAVLDRDYLTIPEEEIGDIRTLMTVVGGKVIHLVPSLAREIGMQPAGAQVTLGGPAAQW